MSRSTLAFRHWELSSVTDAVHSSTPRKPLISTQGSVLPKFPSIPFPCPLPPQPWSSLRILCSNDLHSDLQILSFLHLHVFFFFTFPSSSRLLPILKGGPLEAISKNNVGKAWLCICLLFHGLLILLPP